MKDTKEKKSMNLANKLTITRIILVPLFMIFMFCDNIYTRIFALLIFVGASLTDLYDGRIARYYNCVSNFGKFMDPLADKLLVSAAFISFVQLKELQIPAWMVVFIISREFIITGLRTLAASEGKILSATQSGKFKTTSQMITIIFILLILIINVYISKSWDIEGILTSKIVMGKYYLILFLKKVPFWLMFFTTCLTVFSGISYIVKNKELFKDIK